MYLASTDIYKRAAFKVSKLILACRNVKKGEAAKQIILDSLKPSQHTSIEVWEVDLDNFESVLSFCERVRSQLQRLDGFVANAGIELGEFEVSEGLERTLTINVVSTFFMSILVLPKLRETAKTYSITTNLTIVGSMITIFAPSAQLQVSQQTEILENLSNPKSADMDQRYFLSKLIVHLCARELAHGLSASTADKQHRVVVNHVNPGWCRTDLFRNKGENIASRILLPIIGRTSEMGSRLLVYGVTAGKETHGQYLSECQIKSESEFIRSSEGQNAQSRLWKELSARINKIAPGAMSIIG